MTLTPEQVLARRGGIGGSDAAAALGLSKRKTALQLYLEKRGEFAGDDVLDDEAVWWGRALEPIVRQKYAEITGRVVVMPQGTLRSARHPFMLAHVDGLIEGESRGYEGKTAFHSMGWGEEGSDQIPGEYLLQVHHYLTVMEYEAWDVAVLIGRKFQIYEVARDLEMSEMLIAGETEFARRVREGDPPALDYDHPTACSVIKKLYQGTNGTRLIASESAAAWRATFDRANAAEKAAKAVAESMKARLLEEMGDAALLAFPDGKAYRRQITKRAGYVVAPSEYLDTRFINDGSAHEQRRRIR